MIPQSLLDFFRETSDILRQALIYAGSVVFVALLLYIRALYLQKRHPGKKFDWILLEFKIPKDNIKTPKAMEHVLAGIYSMHNGLAPEEKWWMGKIEYWMSLEMASSREGIRFFIYLPAKFREMVEGSFLSQYPGGEIMEAEDYTKEMPPNLPNEEYDFWGTGFKFDKPNPYPIRTYTYFFEEGKSKEEERRIDPITTMSEIMSALKENERIWVQLLIKPAEPEAEFFFAGKPGKREWRREGEKIISKITGIKKEEEKSPVGSFAESAALFARNLAAAPYEPPVWPEAEKNGIRQEGRRLTAAEHDTIKAIENKTSKLGYETTIRFLYIDSKTEFTKNNAYAMMGAFRQFTDKKLNTLKPDKRSLTLPLPPRYFFIRKWDLLKKKRRLYKHYIKRSFLHPALGKPPILTIEEIATIYHPPVSELVTASGLREIKATKGAPPANLPIG
jgi:hypothetical protein